jgi:hypothetical protein
MNWGNGGGYFEQFSHGPQELKVPMGHDSFSSTSSIMMVHKWPQMECQDLIRLYKKKVDEMVHAKDGASS